MKDSATTDRYKILGGFIIIWITINIIQAAVTGIYADEAYYWIFSRQLQWGYFDHPPAIALLINLGELIGHESFFTRIGTVLLSGASILFLYKAAQQRFADIQVFIIAFLSIAIFHVYGFIATPDGPLFFFTALFFYAYKKYLQADNFKHCLLLAAAITGMLYSKYHGVLPLLFVFLSHPKLVFKRSAWAVVIVVIISLLPHFFWQYQNGWPTLTYHLFDRVASPYRLTKTTNYVIGQVLVWGLLSSFPAFYIIAKLKIKDLYLKAHYYTLIGVFIFFFLFSFKSNIEPHWTLVAGPSFIVLLVAGFENSSKRVRKSFKTLALANLVLIIILRVLLFIPVPKVTEIDNLKSLFYGKQWADSVYKIAGGTPVIFVDSYSLPSLYTYYHPAVQSTTLSTINYRKNHFTMWNSKGELNNKKTYVQVNKKLDNRDVFISSPYNTSYLHLIDSFNAINVLKIKWPQPLKTVKAGALIDVSLLIKNGSNKLIASTPDLKLNYSFFKTRKQRITSADILVSEKQFLPASQIEKAIFLKMPTQPGSYRLVFSLKYFPFEGIMASDYFDVVVR